LYEGYFFEGQPHARGRKFFDDGEIYEGEIVDDEL